MANCYRPTLNVCMLCPSFAPIVCHLLSLSNKIKMPQNNPKKKTKLCLRQMKETSVSNIFVNCVYLWSLQRNTHTQTYQTVLFPGLWEFGTLLLPGHQNLHVLECWVVPCLCLKGHLVLWHRLSWMQDRKRRDVCDILISQKY